MNRLYVDREHADAHRREGRSPAAAAARPRSRRSRGSWRPPSAPARRTGAARPDRRRAEVGRRGRQGSAGARGRSRRRRRRLSAGGGARARARDEPGARQRRHDGDLRRRRSKPTPTDQARVARRARDGDGRRPGRGARHPRRQPGLHRAGGPEVRRAARQGRRCVVYHGLYLDETAELCHWNIPEAHCLESWGDARAYDGTVTLMQPLIAPLYEGALGARSARALSRAARPHARSSS